MSCEFGESLLHGYFDGELRSARAAEFEDHLRHCTQCGDELVELDFLSGRLQLAHLYQTTPASLRRKIRADLSPVATSTLVSQPLLWHWVAAVAALLLLAFAAWRVSPELRSDDYQSEFAGEIVKAHLSSLHSGNMTSVTSDDEHAVKDWFGSRLKFTLPVRDFVGDGFPLRGGRLDVVEGRSLAALVYTRNDHLINVFIWPTLESGTSLREGSRQGFQWVDWRRGKMEFCIVSDADLTDLKKLRELMESSAN